MKKIPLPTWKESLILLLGSGILAFGLYNVHVPAGITEGGIPGLTLLLYQWFHWSPAVAGLILNGLCYFLGWRILGMGFIAKSAVSAVGFSLAYGICEQFDPILPGLSAMPLAAAFAGAIFVGIGGGLCVRMGGASSGDDAVAMGLSRLLRVGIQWIYLACDLTVLGLSLSYIPWRRLMYSLITVVLSGQLIGLVERLGRKKREENPPF